MKKRSLSPVKHRPSREYIVLLPVYLLGTSFSHPPDSTKNPSTDLIDLSNPLKPISTTWHSLSNYQIGYHISYFPYLIREITYLKSNRAYETISRWEREDCIASNKAWKNSFLSRFLYLFLSLCKKTLERPNSWNLWPRDCLLFTISRWFGASIRVFWLSGLEICSFDCEFEEICHLWVGSWCFWFYNF